MAGWQARWWSLIITLLSVWLSARLAGPLPASAQQAHCQLVIAGDGRGGIADARMTCTGGPPGFKVAVNETLLGRFRGNFTGLVDSTSCNAPKRVYKLLCLVTVCSGTLVLKDSRVEGVTEPRQQVKTVYLAADSDDVEGVDLGGVVCVVGSARLLLVNSTLSHNRVRPLVSVDKARILLHGSNLAYNVEEGLGGGVLALDSSSVTIQGDSSVYGNLLPRGVGGVTEWKYANATMGSFNVSQYAMFSGGGVAAGDDASVTITGGSSVHGNEASDYGGGVYAGDNARVIIMGGSSVYGNNASWSGRGVYAVDNASITITGGSSVHDNETSRDGGGMYAGGNARVTITGGSSVYGNEASGGGGGVAAGDNASITITGGSSVHGNEASDVGGGVAAGGNARVTITDGSSVHSNNASWSGGGVYAGDNAIVVVKGGSSVRGNRGSRGSGGGLAARDNASIAITGSSHVCHNLAQEGPGGGLRVGENATVVVKDSVICNNSCTGGLGGGLFVGYNDEKTKFDRGGKLLFDNTQGLSWSNISAHVTIDNTTITNNTSIGFPGGGLGLGANTRVMLLGGTQVVGNRAVNGSGGGAMVYENGTLEVGADVVFDRNSVMQRYVGSAIAAFDTCRLLLPLRGVVTKCSVGVYLGRMPCGPGEEFQPDLGVCACCRSHSYSFDNITCHPCPPNARCTNGVVVEPLQGHWKSHATSVEIHRCPLFDQSCRGLGQCAEGYEGPLCGVCKLPEYGMVSPLRCRKCMPPGTQLGLYLALLFVTVVLVAITVHVTWRDNLAADRTVHATDLIKVVVQFLQYLVIIGTVSVPWPEKFNLQVWFQVAASMLGAASGQALSLDCWLKNFAPSSKLPLAIQRQLVFFLTPVCIFVAAVLLQCLCQLVWTAMRRACGRTKRHQDVWAAARDVSRLVVRKLPVTALVVAYYAYPTLLRAALGFFACLRIDVRQGSSTPLPGDSDPLNHRHGYWVSDIRQECFRGYHLPWALGLGLPAVLLLCIVVPVAMGWGFKANAAKADTAAFCEDFGFLYRNYKHERMWWEAVWAAQTVVLTLVSVFSFPIDRYFSILGLLVVFFVSAGVQTVFRPYAERTLHHMHLTSSACLAATTIGALAMFAYDVSADSAGAVRIVVTVMVLIINVVFVGWCVLKLAPHSWEGLEAHAALDQADPACLVPLLQKRMRS